MLRLEHDDSTFRRDVGPAEIRDGAGATTINRADIDEEDLVFVVMNGSTQFRSKFDQLAPVQFATKDGELQVFPVPKHDFVNTPQSLGM